MTAVSTELNKHIKEKISYHNKQLDKFQAEENYEQCIYHRDEIKRLRSLIIE